MFDNIAAIDIGSTSIKMVLAKTSIKNFKVDLIVHQNIDFSIENHDEAIQDALSSLIAKHDIAGYKVLTNLPLEKAILRNLHFPFKDYDMISQVIEGEAQEVIPFLIDDVSYDFHTLADPENEGSKVLFAATQNEVLENFVNSLENIHVKPHLMGLESNALYATYNHYNDVANENAIQLDIGHNKSIINIIKNNQLVFTRSLHIGTSMIIDSIAKTLKKPYKDAINIFENLHLDITSLDNNYQKSFYKDFKITKPKLKTIFDNTLEIVNYMIEQFMLSIKSYATENSDLAYNRILISGGGSNIIGIGNIITDATEIPIMSLPFSNEYKDNIILTQFPICFGIIFSYLNIKKKNINFLSHDLSAQNPFAILKKFYLPIFFASLGIMIFIINSFISSIIYSKKISNMNEVLEKQFKNYFKKSSTDGDPIKSANEILSKEKSALKKYKLILPPKVSSIKLLTNIISYFPKEANIDLSSMVINKSILKLSGSIDSSTLLDKYKNSLNESGKFDSVKLSTSSGRNNKTRFALSIKLKSGKK